MPASIVRAFAPSMIDPFRRPVRNGLGWELGDGMGRNLTAGSVCILILRHHLLHLPYTSSSTYPFRLMPPLSVDR